MVRINGITSSFLKGPTAHKPVVKRLILLASTPSEQFALTSLSKQVHQEMAWLKGIAQGNVEDFKHLFGFYAPRLKGYLRHLGFSNSVAEELIQEVMISVWRFAAQYNPSLAMPSTWIYRIARNRGIDELRRLKRQQAIIGSEQGYAGLNYDSICHYTPGVEYSSSNDHQKILLFLAELSPNQRQTIEMFFFANKSHSMIAKELGLPLGTIKSRLRLALGHLRKILIGEENPQ